MTTPAPRPRPRHRIAVPALLLILACRGDSAGPEAELSLIILAGNAQSAPAGSAVAIDPVVLVRDEAGAPRAGVVVTFRVTAGDGLVTAEIDTTDAGGRASAAWILGPRAGVANRLVAGAPGTGALVEFTATATPLESGRTLLGHAGYIEMIAGDLPVIIAAPHGGSLTPSAIPDRTVGTTLRDTNTEELARDIRSAFLGASGRAPHVIINRLHRRKLDANREIGEAAAGNPDAERAWHEFHAFIEAAKRHVIERPGAGLFIDLHGHGHPIARLELGYLLTGAELAQSDATLAHLPWPQRTSIRAVIEATGRPLAELLRGASSLGALLAQEGYPGVPSPAMPDPGGEPYFSGGYNTERHGSRDGGTISGVQIEAHFQGVRDDAANRAAFARALMHVLDRWFAEHYGHTLLATPGSNREATAGHLLATGCGTYRLMDQRPRAGPSIEWREVDACAPRP